MEFDVFLEKFAMCFDEKPAGALTYNTDYHELDGWSSMTELDLIYMLDSDYGITVKVDDIRDSKSIGTLFEIIKKRVGV